LGKEDLCTHFRSLSERKGVAKQYVSALFQIPWNLTRDFINALCGGSTVQSSVNSDCQLWTRRGCGSVPCLPPHRCVSLPRPPADRASPAHRAAPPSAETPTTRAQPRGARARRAAPAASPRRRPRRPVAARFGWASRPTGTAVAPRGTRGRRVRRGGGGREPPPPPTASAAAARTAPRHPAPSLPRGRWRRRRRARREPIGRRVAGAGGPALPRLRRWAHARDLPGFPLEGGPPHGADACVAVHHPPAQGRSVGVTREPAGGHPCAEDGPVEDDRAGRPRVVVNARRRILLVPLHRKVLTLTPLKATWTCRTLGGTTASTPARPACCAAKRPSRPSGLLNPRPVDSVGSQLKMWAICGKNSRPEPHPWRGYILLHTHICAHAGLQTRS